MDWEAILLSLKLAAVSSVVLLVIALPLGYWLSFSGQRWRFLVETMVALPLVLPPTVLGFYVLLATGPDSAIGSVYESITGGMLPFSFEGLVLASVLYSLPFAVQPVATAFSSIDRRLVEASRCLGAGKIATFRRVLLPLAVPGILTGLVMSFAHTMGEFGVVLMVGGNIPGETRTIAISIYDQVQSLEYEKANASALFLLVFSFVVLAILFWLRRGRGRREIAAWPQG